MDGCKIRNKKQKGPHSSFPNVCYGRQFTLNKDPFPEYSGDVSPPEEHQIRQDEHGGGESREEGEAAPLHRRRNISLLGNQQKQIYMDNWRSTGGLRAVI